MDDKEKKQEEKELKALDKAKAKILDEQDDLFAGFCAVQLVDGDGVPRLVKGSAAGVPLHVEHLGGIVKLVANFAPNPLMYVGINNDSNLYLCAEAWYGLDKKGPTSTIGSVIPCKCDKLCQALENGGVAEAKFVLPFLTNSAGRLATVKVGVTEERFMTKLASLTIELPAADWMEWKQYRLKFWSQGKVWGADGKPTGGDDKDDKEDGDKKDKKEE